MKIGTPSFGNGINSVNQKIIFWFGDVYPKLDDWQILKHHHLHFFIILRSNRQSVMERHTNGHIYAKFTNW